MDDMDKAMEQAARTIAETPAKSVTDPERLLVAADRLLRAQQTRLLSERSTYEARRTDRMNFYRAEMARLEDEAEGELLALSQEWQRQESAIINMIAKLKALRSA